MSMALHVGSYSLDLGRPGETPWRLFYWPDFGYACRMTKFKCNICEDTGKVIIGWIMADETVYPGDDCPKCKLSRDKSGGNHGKTQQRVC